MTNRLPAILLAVVALLPVVASTAQAQERAEDTWYLRPRAGLSYYLGDNDKAVNFKKGDLFETTPINAALEIGYRFSPTYSVGVAFSYSAFGNINDFDRLDDNSPIIDTDYSDEDGTRIGVQLLARHLYSKGKIAPFVQAGLGLSFGETRYFDGSADETKIAAGPLLGIGFDIALSERISFGIESGLGYYFGDKASDGTDNDDTDGAGVTGGFGPGDLLGWNTLSLGFNLKKFVPVMVTDVVCPMDAVLTGEPVTFSASVNDDATPIVNAAWDFGDGATASGLTATHTFNRAGSYNVTVTVENGNGRAQDSRQCTVMAEDPVVAPTIVSMSANPMSPDTQSSIGFDANVQGTAPFTYSWDFGDGNTSTMANPRHTYSEPGTYTVTLEACNPAGCDTRTMEITVAPYEAAICREIEEMNTVFFARNSSTLTPEARELLQDNLEILQECPNLNARVEGWAAPGERRSDQLSLARANAVEQFYIDNGIAASRLVTVGMGRAQGMTSKKEGLSQFRRADTIPVRN